MLLLNAWHRFHLNTNKFRNFFETPISLETFLYNHLRIALDVVSCTEKTFKLKGGFIKENQQKMEQLYCS